MQCPAKKHPAQASAGVATWGRSETMRREPPRISTLPIGKNLVGGFILAEAMVQLTFVLRVVSERGDSENGICNLIARTLER